jgi:hypothetical protein
MRLPLCSSRVRPRARFHLSRRIALWTLFCAALGWAALPGARAEGSAGVPAEVLVVLGSNEGSGVDPQLDKIEALRKAPFDSFSKKTLLQRVEVRLSVGSSAEVELPNGRKLRLALLETLKDGRFRLSLSINKPGQRDYLPVMTVAAAPGDPFFVAGQKHDGGTLIIGVRAGAVRS